MNENNVLTFINNEIDDESKRIFEILMDLYNSHKKVNMSFSELIEKYINPKYKTFIITIQRKIIKMIPADLNICPTGEFVFVKNDELDEIKDEKYWNKMQLITGNVIKNLKTNFLDNPIDHLLDVLLEECDKNNLRLDQVEFTYLISNVANALCSDFSSNDLKTKKEDD